MIAFFKFGDSYILIYTFFCHDCILGPVAEGNFINLHNRELSSVFWIHFTEVNPQEFAMREPDKMGGFLDKLEEKLRM